MRLVFLHGGGMTSTMWRPQINALGAEFDVLALDLPGHRNRDGDRFSFPAAIAELERALADGAPSVLIGLSLGGYVAMAAVEQRPSIAAGLVLSGCSIDFGARRNRAIAWAGGALLRLWPERGQVRM